MPSSNHFKALPWDFVQQRGQILPSSGEGLFSFFCNDLFLEQILRDKSLEHFKDVKKIVGSDLTREWLENEFQTLSLFSENYSYMVLHADQMSSKVAEYLLSGEFTPQGRFLCLFFQKDKKAFDKFKKSEDVAALEVTPPRFWEGAKHLEFIADYFEINLSYEVQSFLVKNLEQSSSEYWNTLSALKLHTGNIDLSFVQKIVRRNWIDLFEMASLFGSKAKKRFYYNLIHSAADFDQLRSLFSFMQGHLSKLVDTSYIDKKNRPSKYDKEIQAHAKLWDKKDLVSSIELFSSFEILSKSKSDNLHHALRREYLRSF